MHRAGGARAHCAGAEPGKYSPLAVAANEHASMMIIGSGEDISTMPGSGRQTGSCLAPWDFNACYKPRVENWNKHPAARGSADGLLRTRRPTLKLGEEMGSGLATCMSDATRNHAWPGTPNVEGAVQKISHATEALG
eukprot:664082-Pyramimonas_sp.AAC.1